MAGKKRSYKLKKTADSTESLQEDMFNEPVTAYEGPRVLSSQANENNLYNTTVVKPGSQRKRPSEKSGSSVNPPIPNEAFIKSRFLSNSICFFSFMLSKLGVVNSTRFNLLKLALLSHSYTRVLGNGNSDASAKFEELITSFKLNPESYEVDEALFVFIALMEKVELVSDYNKGNIPLFTYGFDIVAEIEAIKHGKNPLSSLYDLVQKINFDKEIKGLLLKFFEQYHNRLNKINFIEISSSLTQYLQAIINPPREIEHIKILLNAFCFVMERSTKAPKDVIGELISESLRESDELQSLIKALFIIHLFYGKPYDNPIPISLLDPKLMTFVLPQVEVFVYPKPIIEAAKGNKQKLERLFWLYTFNREDTILNSSAKLDEVNFISRLIEVKERVITNKIIFGNYIEVVTEIRETGEILFNCPPEKSK